MDDYFGEAMPIIAEYGGRLVASFAVARGEVEAADEAGRGVDRGSRMFDLEHKGLSEAVTRNVGLISVARPLLLCLLSIKVRCCRCAPMRRSSPVMLRCSDFRNRLRESVVVI